jgi:hypothetical protein
VAEQAGEGRLDRAARPKISKKLPGSLSNRQIVAKRGLDGFAFSTS